MSNPLKVGDIVFISDVSGLGQYSRHKLQEIGIVYWVAEKPVGGEYKAELILINGGFIGPYFTRRFTLVST